MQAAGLPCSKRQKHLCYPTIRLPRVFSRPLLLAFAVTLACLASFAPARAVEFRNLVLICPDVVIPQLGYNEHLSAAEIAQARQAFTVDWPNRISQITGGQVTLKNTVVVVRHTVTSCEKLRDPNARPCVWPDNFPPTELEDYCHPGWYDAVICYNAIPDFQYVTSGGFEPKAGDTSWCCINKITDFDMTNDPFSGITHEWEHTLEAYYYHDRHYDGGIREAGQGVRNDVHGGSDDGYTPDSDGQGGKDGKGHWWAWYRDLLLMKIPKTGGGFNGFGPAAWKQFGTPRSRHPDVGIAFGGDDNQLYKLELAHDGQVVDVYKQQITNGTAITQYPYSGGANQKFKIAANGDGTFRLVASHSGKVVDVAKAGKTSGAALIQKGWTGAASQHWYIDYVGSGTYRLRNKNSGKAADILNGTTTPGTPLIQSGWNGASNQSFLIS